MLTVFVDAVEDTGEDPFNAAAGRSCGGGRPHVGAEGGILAMGFDAPGDALAEVKPMPSRR